MCPFLRNRLDIWYYSDINDWRYMKMELLNGRPLNLEGRLNKEIRVYDNLDNLGINYDRVDHPAAGTMEECHKIENVLGANICKNLFLCNRQKTNFYLLMMPADKVFKTKELSKQIGSARLSFAGAEEMETLLDITPGAMSVMGLMNDKDNQVRLLVDEDLLEDEYLGCHPCVNTSCIKLKMRDVTEVYLEATKHDMTVVKLVGED